MKFKYITRKQILALTAVIVVPILWCFITAIEYHLTDEEIGIFIVKQMAAGIILMSVLGSVVIYRKRKHIELPLISENVLKVSIPFVVIPSWLGMSLNYQYHFEGTARIVSSVLLGILAAVYAANLIACFVMTKKYGSRSIKTNVEQTLSEGRDVRADIASAKKKLKRLIFRAEIYRLLVALCAFCFFFFCIPLAKFAPYALCALWLVFVTDFFDPVFNKTDIPDNLGIRELGRDEIPMIYAIAEDAMRAVGVKGTLHLTVDPSMPMCMGVVYNKKHIHILLGAVELHFMNEKELRAVLLHEFSHVKFENYDEIKRINAKVDKFRPNASLLPYTGKIFSMYYTAAVNYEYDKYSAFSSIECEKKSDEGAIANSDPHDFVNNLAKAYAVRAADRAGITQKVIYTCYAEEKPVEDIAERLTAAFDEYIRNNEAKIRTRIEKEIPMPLATHPTFAMRRAAAGNVDYSFFTEDTSSDFTAEKAKVEKAYDKEYVSEIAEHYDEYRYQYYISRKEFIDEAYAAEDLCSIPVHERYVMCSALDILDDEKEIEIMDSILAENPDDTYTKIRKAAILDRNDDDRCVALYFEAAQQSKAHSESCFDKIMTFAYTHGRQDIIDEYEDRIYVMLQQNSDESTDYEFDSRSKLAKNDLPDAVQKEIADTILSIGGTYLYSFYSVKKLNKNGRHKYVYILEFRSGAWDTDANRVYRQIFTYLDNRDEDFMLIDSRELETTAYLVKKVPGCETRAASDEK